MEKESYYSTFLLHSMKCGNNKKNQIWLFISIIFFFINLKRFKWILKDLNQFERILQLSLQIAIELILYALSNLYINK